MALLFPWCRRWLIASLGGLEREVVISIASKSVTIPFAVEITKIAGGDTSLVVAFVVATGTLGAILGPAFLTWIRINDPVCSGISVGNRVTWSRSCNGLNGR